MKKLNQSEIDLAKKYLYYKENPVTFIEENLYIPTPGGDELLKLYEPQKKIINDFFDNNYLILLKSRQTGFSTLSQAIISYICTFFDNVIMGVISRDGSESSDFCRKVEDMLDKLPAWLRPTYKSKSVQSFILTSGCQLWSSAISPANPGAVFRGKSITLLIIDEAAHIMRIDEAWTGVAPALSKAQMAAKQAGIPYGTIILSTPNKTEGIGKWFFQNWESAINSDSIFLPHRIHWTEIPLFANDPNWYKNQCAILGNDHRKIAQELELKFIGSDNTLFDEATQEKLQQIKYKPLEKISLGPKLEIWKFKEINPKKFHLIGVDTASESGLDFSGIEVFEFDTMEQVMEFKGKLAVKKFAEIVKVCAKLVPHNIIIVENNSYGNQVVEELDFDDDYSFNLFGEYKGTESNKDFIAGINTNTKTRPLIIDSLYTYVTENPELIKSERLALELLGLSSKRNRVEAEAGANDDLALSYAFICYARHYCQDLLGNTDPVEETETIDSIETLDLVINANDFKSPLKHAYRNEEFNQFKRTLDRYIKTSIDNGGTGVVNIFNMIGAKEDGKWEASD
jgi:hypothetical protein